MLIAVLHDGTFLVGIDAGNVQRLLEHKPMIIDLRGPTNNPNMPRVVLSYGDTLDDIVGEIKSMVSRDTKVIDHRPVVAEPPPSRAEIEKLLPPGVQRAGETPILSTRLPDGSIGLGFLDSALRHLLDSDVGFVIGIQNLNVPGAPLPPTIHIIHAPTIEALKDEARKVNDMYTRGAPPAPTTSEVGHG